MKASLFLLSVSFAGLFLTYTIVENWGVYLLRLAFSMGLITALLVLKSIAREG